MYFQAFTGGGEELKKEVEEDWLELIATRLMSSASKLDNL